MSSVSEPPYPPGRYPHGGQATPAALPARRARALPAAPSPSRTDDAADDTTIPGSAILPTTQAGANGPVGQPGGFQGTTTGGYAGPGSAADGSQEAGGWFARTSAPQHGNQGQGWQDFPGRAGSGNTADVRRDGYGPGGFGGNAGAPGAGMPGGYPGGGPGYPGQQPGSYAGQPPSAGYPGQPPAGFAGQTLPGAQGPLGPSGPSAGPGYGGPGDYPPPQAGFTAQPGFGPQPGFAPQPGPRAWPSAAGTRPCAAGRIRRGRLRLAQWLPAQRGLSDPGRVRAAAAAWIRLA